MLKAIFQKAANLNFEKPGRLGVYVGGPLGIAAKYIPAFQRAAIGLWSHLGPVTQANAGDVMSASAAALISGLILTEAAVGYLRRRSASPT